ncbi:hypothetical protein ACX80O_02275 [Arthrobacter sp. Hz1]
MKVIRAVRSWWHQNICGPLQPGYLGFLDLLDGTRLEEDREMDG